MDHRTTIFMLRVFACVVLLAAIGACIGQLKAMPDLATTAVLTPIAVLVFGIGIAAMLVGVAAILQQRPNSSADSQSDSRLQSRLVELSIKIEDLAISVERLNQRPEPTLTAVDPSSAPADDTHAALDKLQAYVEELHVLSTLPDEQRRVRWQEMEGQRRKVAIQKVTASIQSRQWAEAENAIKQMEKEWGSDEAIGTCREQLEKERGHAENEAVELAASQIESDMSLSQWDQATGRAQTLVKDFPASATAARMLDRVEREKAIYTDSTVQRLYDEIRHAVERRSWRRALEYARELLEKFPGHTRSALIRKQIKTIEDNAEIEERQEQETRIGELVRARRFQEAVDLAEELIVRFPASPQAVAIEKLLPKIRQFAAEAQSRAESSSIG